jgi:hypothetical protein
MLRRFLAFVAAATLIAAPAAAAPAPAPARASVEGSAIRGVDTAYWILPALIVLALLVAILAKDQPKATPLSP